MSAFILPPAKLPWYIRLGAWFTRRAAGKDLLPPYLLAWYPRAALSSAVLEGLVAHGEGRLTPRLLKLVRLQVSLTVGCPFCVDMNGFDPEKLLLPAEVIALQTGTPLATVASFSPLERLALAYTRALSHTPLELTPLLVAELQAALTEREWVILATTIAQVNYWTRLLQGLGVPPAGFAATCARPE